MEKIQEYMLLFYSKKLRNVKEDKERILCYDSDIDVNLKIIMENPNKWDYKKNKPYLEIVYAQKIPLNIIELGDENVIKILPKLLTRGKVTDMRLNLDKDRKHVILFIYIDAPLNKYHEKFALFPCEEQAINIIETSYDSKWLRREGEEPIKKKTCIIL